MANGATGLRVEVDLMKRLLAESSSEMADVVEGIIALPRAELIAMWPEHYGDPPPKSDQHQIVGLFYCLCRPGRNLWRTFDKVAKAARKFGKFGKTNT